MRIRTLFLLFILLLPVGAAAATPTAERPGSLPPEIIPDLISAIRMNGPLAYCNEEVPLDDQMVRERMEKEMLLILWDRPQIILWMKRAGKYMTHIEKTLAANNLPDDLKYVPFIESGLRSDAGSPKGAMGYWQFIPATGIRYGLTIDAFKDERRNIFASTAAAVRYFKDLYDEFHSWTLATAAYNLGEERLEDSIERQGGSTFYQLDLPEETERYLLRIVVAKLLLTNPQRYGFHLEPGDIWPVLDFERVKVACDDTLPIRLVADAAGSYYREIKELNPEWRGDFLPKGQHLLAVPKGSGNTFKKRYPSLLAQWQAENSKIIYRGT